MDVTVSAASVCCRRHFAASRRPKGHLGITPSASATSDSPNRRYVTATTSSVWSMRPAGLAGCSGKDLLVRVHAPLADILFGHRHELDHGQGLLSPFVGCWDLDDGRRGTVYSYLGR